MSHSMLFEAFYNGTRHAGFGTPGPGTPQTLYPVAAGQLASALLAGAGSLEEIETAVAEHAPAVTVASGDPALRLLPPLLPEATGNALLSGFLGTHEKKWRGKPAPDPESAPEKWFFKGFGDWIRMPGQTLRVAGEPVALVEEPEIALVYVNDADGTPHYAGYTFGNDLSDIGWYRRDPGYTAYCKLCDTALAPWLFPGEPPRSVPGEVAIERDGATAWAGKFDCGTDALYFPVRDMVQRMFSFPALRRPGLVNYVLLGADESSFHDGFRIADGDRISIEVTSHGVTFGNTVRFTPQSPFDPGL